MRAENELTNEQRNKEVEEGKRSTLISWRRIREKTEIEGEKKTKNEETRRGIKKCKTKRGT